MTGNEKNNIKDLSSERSEIDNEKLPDVGIILESEGAKRFDNFWYYNKWKVLIIGLVVLIVLLSVLQTCEGRKIDTYVVYSGSYAILDSSIHSGMRSAFEAVLPYDLNNDGVKDVQIVSTYVLSESQIESINEITDEQGSREYQVDIGFNVNELERFDNIIMTGEYSICLLEPWLYERVKNNGGFVRLDELFDNLPECAIDDYGIHFSETEFAKYFSVFEVLPIDTILCLRTPSSFIGGVSKDSDEYKLSIEMFKSIVNFIPQQ